MSRLWIFPLSAQILDLLFMNLCYEFYLCKTINCQPGFLVWPGLIQTPAVPDRTVGWCGRSALTSVWSSAELRSLQTSRQKIVSKPLITFREKSNLQNRNDDVKQNWEQRGRPPSRLLNLLCSQNQNRALSTLDLHPNELMSSAAMGETAVCWQTDLHFLAGTSRRR